MTTTPHQKASTPHPEIIKVDPATETVSCNGAMSNGNRNAGSDGIRNAGALGHPKVFYTFHGQDEIVCGYCDRLFSKK